MKQPKVVRTDVPLHDLEGDLDERGNASAIFGERRVLPGFLAPQRAE
jgi:hypothetical protein